MNKSSRILCIIRLSSFYIWKKHLFIILSFCDCFVPCLCVISSYFIMYLLWWLIAKWYFLIFAYSSACSKLNVKCTVSLSVQCTLCLFFLRYRKNSKKSKFRPWIILNFVKKDNWVEEFPIIGIMGLHLQKSPWFNCKLSLQVII